VHSSSFSHCPLSLRIAFLKVRVTSQNEGQCFVEKWGASITSRAESIGYLWTARYGFGPVCRKFFEFGPRNGTDRVN